MPVISALSPVSLSSYFDPNTGAVMAVNLFFYAAGTLDPITVYSNADLSVPLPSPLMSTGYGRVPPVFIGEMADPGYRVRVFDQYSQLVEDLDNLPGAVVPDGGGGGEGPVQPDDVHLLKTGDYVFSTRNATPREGAVLANGLTIGSAASPATGRANADAHDLFVHLWQSDEFGLLPVLPSRGVSAEGDWLANKVITLPDLRCTAIVGMDGMGSALTNRFEFVPKAGAAHLPSRISARGGTILETLITIQMPQHTHVVTDPGHVHAVAIPAHGHTFSNGLAADNGFHSHTGNTTFDGAHFHTYFTYNNAYGLGLAGNPTAVPAAPIEQNNTSSAGGHFHNLQVNGAGLHSHTVTGTISNYAGANINSGSNVTGITLQNAGANAAHNNTQLFVTVSVYLVL